MGMGDGVVGRSGSSGGTGSAPGGAEGDGVVGEAASPAPIQGFIHQGEGPRERLMRLGSHVLSDAELVAVLLGSGTRGNPVQSLAHELLQAGGGLRALVQRDPQELLAMPGMGPARAAQVVAALELGRRAQRARELRPRFDTPKRIFDYVWPQLCALQREVFHVLCLNGRNVLVADVRVAEGSQDLCPVDPREVFRAGLMHRAAGVVLIHNHPSGEPTPSGADLSLTRHLARVGRVLRIKVLDHVIVGDGRYHSMLEAGQMRRIDDEVEVEGWAAADERTGGGSC